jgi:hypothetical protein
MPQWVNGAKGKKIHSHASTSDAGRHVERGRNRGRARRALLAHIDANAWASMPAELKAACTCGQLHQPAK